MNADAARINYFKWLAVAHPDIYARVEPKLRVRLGALGFIAALVNALVQVGSVVVQKKQADKQLSLAKKTLAVSDAQAAADRDNQLKLALLDVNTKRAQAGLGPVDLNGNPIQSQSLPTPQALSTAPSATNRYLLIGGGVLALGALVLLLRR